MKERITMKAIKNGFNNIIEVSYCELSSLLRYSNPNYYTCGVYGWNADIYIINTNTVIVTGYRPFGNIRNRKIVKKYEEEARKILETKWNYEEQKKYINILLLEFIEEITKEEKIKC